MIFLLFIVVPFVELMLLIEVGSHIGTLETIIICVGTGAVGASLAKSQGVAVIGRLREAVAFGRDPSRAIVDGVLIVLSAAVLITPGLITDAVGLFLLFPPTRALVRPTILRWARARILRGNPMGRGPGPGRGGWPPRDEEGGGGPDQEFLPPGAGPRPPQPRKPDILDQ